MSSVAQSFEDEEVQCLKILFSADQCDSKLIDHLKGVLYLQSNAISNLELSNNSSINTENIIFLENFLKNINFLKSCQHVEEESFCEQIYAPLQFALKGTLASVSTKVSKKEFIFPSDVEGALGPFQSAMNFSLSCKDKLTRKYKSKYGRRWNKEFTKKFPQQAHCRKIFFSRKKIQENLETNSAIFELTQRGSQCVAASTKKYATLYYNQAGKQILSYSSERDGWYLSARLPCSSVSAFTSETERTFELLGKSSYGSGKISVVEHDPDGYADDGSEVMNDQVEGAVVEVGDYSLNAQFLEDKIKFTWGNGDFVTISIETGHPIDSNIMDPVMYGKNCKSLGSGRVVRPEIKLLK